MSEGDDDVGEVVSSKPVTSWRCQRQAGAMKALQRIVWSLIVLGFGAHLVKCGKGCREVSVQQRMSEKDFSNSPSRRQEDASLEDLWTGTG